MIKTTVTIDGMMCSMCEEHVSTLFKDHLPDIKKVKANHHTNKVSFLSKEALSDEAITLALDKSGYRIEKIEREEFVKNTTFASKFAALFKKDE